MRCVP